VGVERVEIVTERLKILPVSAEMVDDIFDAVTSSADDISRWMAWASDITYEDEVAFVRSAQAAWDQDAMWAFTFWHDGRLAGGVGLTRHGVAYLRRAELGYWIRSSVAGRGLTTEAVAAVTEFGFTVLGLHRLELYASPGNSASHRIAEKIGFSKEGEHRDATAGRSGFLDTYSYGLLETDPRLKLDPLEIRPQG
jgi:ribosomal-protein-serine acetyltransferase